MTFDEREPIYRQIAEQLREEILSGSLQEGERVSSTNEFANHYRINPATVAKAFGELVDEGVLNKRRGVGMFVTEGAREKLLRESRARFFAETVEPMAKRATLLGIGIQEVIEYLQTTDERRQE